MWKSISDASWQYINLPLSLSPSLALVELKKYLMHEQEQGGGEEARGDGRVSATRMESRKRNATASKEPS